MNPHMKIISLGGGVQSVTMTAMSVLGDLERADCAIFADTGWERQHTYDYLQGFILWCEEHGFPIYKVSKGNIKKDAVAGLRWDNIPFFTKTDKGVGRLRRQCTGYYKIHPIRRKIRELGGKRVELWIGFSVDELVRASPSQLKWITHRFPLLEQRMRRSDCVAWLEKHGLGVPHKSACVCCVYRKDSEWQKMDSDEFKAACEFDDLMRNNPKSHLSRHLNWPVFLHRSCQPLHTRPFDHNVGQMELWKDEECQGGCWL